MVTVPALQLLVVSYRNSRCARKLVAPTINGVLLTFSIGAIATYLQTDQSLQIMFNRMERIFIANE